VIIKGESIRQVQPEYPQVARAARQAGVVSVEVSINDHGDVVSAHALGGPTLLREPAISAARRWKFRPATRDGKPVACSSVITFNFRL
jgi:protein TonB